MDPKLSKLILLGLTSLMVLPAPAVAVPFDAQRSLDAGIHALKRSEYSLARAYLTPLLPYWGINDQARAVAYYLRGQSFYSEGLPVSARKDYVRALEFDADNADVRTALGRLYLHGEGVEANTELAFTFLAPAAEEGQIEAAFHLGIAHLSGLGVEPDLAIARRWLTKAAEAGQPSAMTHLAASYRTPYASEPDLPAAIGWYDRAIALGHPNAMVAKSYLLGSGELDAADQHQAIDLLNRAVALGSNDARVALGYRYLTGQGVAANAARAYELVATAARGGGAQALLQLGHMQQHGLGTTVDLAGAEAAYDAAARRGLVAAMLRLGQLLLGDAEPARRAEGLEWLHRSTAGNEAAAHNQYAWALATDLNADVRDGAKAIEAAQRAVTLERSPSYLDTLAAAYAEAGQFTQAVNAQTEAMELAEALALPAPQAAALEDELARHLAAYRAGKPWRE